MGRDRSRKQPRTRRENTREIQKSLPTRDLLTFSFKDLDQTQPKSSAETLQVWASKQLLAPLLNRLKELTTLTRDEAVQQRQIKIYNEFPPNEKTSFEHPLHVEDNVTWAVIEGLGGKPRVAGYLVENTFYVVFLDSEHQFFRSDKKNT